MRSEEITRAYSRSRRRLRFVFQNRRSWSAVEMGWLITPMLLGAESLALVLRRLCAGLASNMEPARVLLSRCVSTDLKAPHRHGGNHGRKIVHELIIVMRKESAGRYV